MTYEELRAIILKGGNPKLQRAKVDRIRHDGWITEVQKTKLCALIDDVAVVRKAREQVMKRIDITPEQARAILDILNDEE